MQRLKWVDRMKQAEWIKMGGYKFIVGVGGRAGPQTKHKCEAADDGHHIVLQSPAQYLITPAPCALARQANSFCRVSSLLHLEHFLYSRLLQYPQQVFGRMQRRCVPKKSSC